MTTIIAASLKDIPGIIAVNKENLLVNQAKLCNDVLAQQGFLISPTTLAELGEIILNHQQVIALVAKEENVITGYALGYALPYWNQLYPEWKNTLQLSSIIEHRLATTNVLYYRHIARRHDKKGTGQFLLQALLVHAKSREYQHVLCAIAHEPLPNQISQDFHKRFGFDLVGKQVVPDHIMGLYLKDITP